MARTLNHSFACSLNAQTETVLTLKQQRGDGSLGTHFMALEKTRAFQTRTFAIMACGQSSASFFAS
jgi:hypothetical protein